MDNSEDRILPLINIVFLLLIFFMVVGQLAPSDALVEEPLESTAAQSIDTRAQPAAVLQMGRDGSLALDGERLEEDAVLDSLQTAFRSLEPPSGVQVKADGRTEAVAAIRLIHRLREAEIPAVNLMTLQAEN